MSIPKVIHYCWFGRGEKSELIQKCIESWKKYCPEYEIIEWNEDNFDVNFCPYAAKAYKEKRYGFLADVARLEIIYNQGGIYLDTDVELIRPIDELQKYGAWFGYGTATEINTGSGFGAIKSHFFVKKLLDQYVKFDEKHPYELCTVVDTRVFIKEFSTFAGDHDVMQIFSDVAIINNNWHYLIHHYTGTWIPKYKKFLYRFKLVKFLRDMIKRVLE